MVRWQSRVATALRMDLGATRVVVRYGGQIPIEPIEAATPAAPSAQSAAGYLPVRWCVVGEWVDWGQ